MEGVDHFTQYELKELQALPLAHKETRTLERIRAFLLEWQGGAYVAFSGGKDSTVLRHLVRRVDASAPAVFANTGLEYPEIVQFVRSRQGVVVVRPEESFRKVIETHGYPVVSKKVSQIVESFQRPTAKNVLSRRNAFKKEKRLSYLAEKWRFLLNAPFKISPYCCHALKRRPLAEYQKATGRAPFVGVMANEGGRRERSYKKTGCLITEGKYARAWPMGFWTDEDVWGYIQKYNLPYCNIYDTGVRRTGCIFCMFGVDHDLSPNRFQRLRESHPAQYRYCMDKLGLHSVLTFMGVPH